MSVCPFFQVQWEVDWQTHKTNRDQEHVNTFAYALQLDSGGCYSKMRALEYQWSMLRDK